MLESSAVPRSNAGRQAVGSTGGRRGEEREHSVGKQAVGSTGGRRESTLLASRHSPSCHLLIVENRELESEQSDSHSEQNKH